MKKTEREQYNWKFQKIKNDPQFAEWRENQSNLSSSLNTLVQFAIRLLGTSDISDFDAQTKLAKLYLLNDQQFITEIANKLGTTPTNFVPVDSVVNQEVTAVKEEVQEIEKVQEIENVKPVVKQEDPKEIENTERDEKYKEVDESSIFG